MAGFLKTYGATVGPLGFPMADKQARALELLLRTLPRSREYDYRKQAAAQPPTEVNPGERSDVSWISTESVDRCGEVVIARGMNDSQFQNNPLVTLGHAYDLPPVGRSLWRKRVKDGTGDHALVGVKAKTKYPQRPDSWPAQDGWPPDKVFSLVQAGMLQGKSIGFLPTRAHFADGKEARGQGWPEGTLVFDEWLLLEYAVCFLPANPDALVEQVSKGALDVPAAMLAALGLDPALAAAPADPAKNAPLPAPVSFTSLTEVERAVQMQLCNIDFAKLAEERVAQVYDARRGRV